MYEAAVARAEADWVVGINATRALTVKYNAQLSTGRVQTPTLAMIAEREKQIRDFKPKSFYGMQALTETAKFTWHDKAGQTQSFDKAAVEKLMGQLDGVHSGKVTDVKTTPKSQPAPSLIRFDGTAKRSASPLVMVGERDAFHVAKSYMNAIKR